MATGAISKMALYLAAILPTATLIIVRSKRSVEDSLQPIEMSSVCQQCSNVVSTSGTRTRTRGEAVRLTVLPGSPRNDQSKSRFGREPAGPITVMMEEEMEVSKSQAKERLFVILVSTAWHLIWNLRVNRVIKSQDMILNTTHIYDQWLNTINKLVLNAWSGLLLNEDSLPDGWTYEGALKWDWINIRAGVPHW
ncbi:hypothetical protein C8J57DRAFT_1258527 [Mycena rebaudengoi]|nr:hypothetical protein C8J57DRAFT_1258527 [Mycena rebaudengoi]